MLYIFIKNFRLLLTIHTLKGPPTHAKFSWASDVKISKFSFKILFYCHIMDKGARKFNNVHEYLTTALLFGQIHLCIDKFIIFTITVSTLLTGSEMLKNVQTGILHRETLPVWVALKAVKCLTKTFPSCLICMALFNYNDYINTIGASMRLWGQMLWL